MDQRAELEHLDATLPADVVRTRDVAAASLTTWRVGGPIAMVLRAGRVADVEAIAAAIGAHVPVLVVGRGSNLLVADAGFPGVAIVLDRALEAVTLPEPAEDGAAVEVHAGAGAALPVLARQLAANGWSGLEFYVGIPGSVGGALRMNAGGHGCDTAAVLRRANVVTLGEPAATWRTVGELAFGYRHSALGARDVAVGATFTVTPDDPAECTARVDEIVRWRRANQPGGANAGSVFRNPPDDSAGRLIDESGLKAERVGGASVSDKHANFIQTEPGATAADVYRLVTRIRGLVAERTGVDLVPEVRIIGFDHPPDGGEETRP